MPGISEDEIAAHFSLLPDRYFVHTDASEIALHIQMVNQLLKSITAADSVGSLRPVIEWRDDLNRSLTVVNVVTWDRAGLFYKLAGAFSVAGLNILGAKVISRTDHIAIDTFYVVEPGRGVVQSAAAQEAFARNIEASLVTNKDLYPDIVAQAKKIAATRYLSTTNLDTFQSSFPPTVDVYHELSMQRTIVEVQARDQLGLLYRLAKTISEHGFDITFARIGTERGVAIDTFYIEKRHPRAGRKPRAPPRAAGRAGRGDHPAAGGGDRGRALTPAPRAPKVPGVSPSPASLPPESAAAEALLAIATLATRTDDANLALQRILEVILEALPAQGGAIALLNPDTGKLEIEASAAPPAAAERTFNLGQGLAGWAAFHTKPALAPDTAADPRCQPPPPGVRSQVAAPLQAADGQAIGVDLPRPPRAPRLRPGRTRPPRAPRRRGLPRAAAPLAARRTCRARPGSSKPC